MMGADAPKPPRARSSAAPDGAPPRRISGKEREASGKIIPQNPLQPYGGIIATGGCPCGGGAKPPRAHSAENLGATSAVTPAFTDIKTHQNHCIPPFGYLPGPAGSTMVADLKNFPGKTGAFFPDQESPLFSCHIVIPVHPGVPHDQLILPLFTVKRTRLNCTVFS
jgi:hypothetical protein